MAHSMKKVFKNRHVVLPVIHTASLEQAKRNTKLAMDLGADGVFLINHGMSVGKLETIACKIAKEFDPFWIGCNFLGASPEMAASIAHDTFAGGEKTGISGIWTDNAGVYEEEDNSEAERTKQIFDQSKAPILYFGGTAFKYQRQPKDLVKATRLASKYMHVVCTSGAGTGKAASPEKIAVMKAALGDHPLSIASGITPDNVKKFLPHADAFLVATGISYTFEELDRDLTKELIDNVRAYKD